MNPERFRQIEELYHAAREGTPEQRAALLDQTDPELRREVESLLSRLSGGDFLAPVAAAVRARRFAGFPGGGRIGATSSGESLSTRDRLHLDANRFPEE
jgi:hypothetical protein